MPIRSVFRRDRSNGKIPSKYQGERRAAGTMHRCCLTHGTVALWQHNHDVAGHDDAKRETQNAACAHTSQHTPDHQPSAQSLPDHGVFTCVALDFS